MKGPQVPTLHGNPLWDPNQAPGSRLDLDGTRAITAAAGSWEGRGGGGGGEGLNRRSAEEGWRRQDERPPEAPPLSAGEGRERAQHK